MPLINKRVSGVISLDRLCQDFGVETMEQYNDRLYEYDSGVFSAAYDMAVKEGYNDDEATKIATDAEQADNDESSRNYANAIVRVAERLYGEHNLLLFETKKNSGLYRVLPQLSWQNSLQCLIQTINGVGMFSFSSVREMVYVSSSKSYREAVIKHLHHIPDWVRVYESGTAAMMVERAQR